MSGRRAVIEGRGMEGRLRQSRDSPMQRGKVNIIGGLGRGEIRGGMGGFRFPFQKKSSQDRKKNEL